MKTETAAYTQLATKPVLKPRYSIALSFDDADTDITWLTSHSDCLDPGGVAAIDRIDGCIQGISGQSQKISPDKAQHTIGSITIKIADINGEFSTKVKTKLDGGEGLRKKQIVLYKGHEDLTAWSDYGKRLTYLVDGVSYKDKVYTLRCSDIQRSTKTDIFDIHQGVLTSTLAKSATTVPITIANAVSKFPLVAHDAVYSGNPSTTIGYIKIDDEIIAHSGWTDANYDTLQVVERGALNTVDVEHTVTATEIDKRKKVDEYIYLEMPAAKLIYALLTGNLEGQAATLPTHWHLAIDTKYVTLSDFTGIGSDLWDTTNNTGRIARFMGLKKTAAKAFIEKEILLWLGSYMPVYSDGSYGLRRLENVLPYTSYIAALDANEISSYGELVYDQNSVINNIAIKWNWIDSLDKYAKTTSLIDSNSISKYGVAPLKTYEFKGVFTGNQSDQALQNYFNQIRDRYTAPPLRLKLTVQPQWDRLDVGDIIRIDCSQILDYHNNAELSRSFEIQQITTDWITGKVVLDLFGGVEAATYSPISSSNVMLDSYYTATGTNLASVLTIVGGAVTASGTINGNSDLTAAGAIYYYNGNLTINSGVTVTINNNVQLRIKGFLTVNGTIDGNGNGVAGVAATGTKDGQFATEGVLKSSLQLESYSVKTYTNRTSYNFQYNGMRYSSMMSLTGKNIINDNGASVDFGITDLRGPGGASGIAAWDDNNSTIISAGVGGGNGGAGLAVICRGVSFGLSAVIDLSGVNGTEPVGGAYSDSNVSSVTVYGGGGQGGGSGSLVILIDGNYSSPLLVDNVTVDDGLDGYAEQADNHKSYYFNATDNVSYGYMPSFLATLDANRKIEYHTLVRYIPVSEIGYVWYPADEEQQVTGYQNKPTDWVELTDKTNTAPDNNATATAPNNMFFNGSLEEGSNIGWNAGIYQAGVGYKSGGALLSTGGFSSTHRVPVNDDKQYTFSTRFKGDVSSPLYYGLNFYDGDNQIILFEECFHKDSSDIVTLSAPLNIGDTFAVINAPTNWATYVYHSRMMFDVFADGSDLPNRNLIRIYDHTDNGDGTWSVNFGYWASNDPSETKIPVTAQFAKAAGTPVTTSHSGASRTYLLKAGTPTGNWENVSSDLFPWSGDPNQLPLANMLRPGAKTMGIYLSNGGTNTYIDYIEAHPATTWSSVKASDINAPADNATVNQPDSTTNAGIIAAQSTADEKAKVFTVQPQPPYFIGDLWDTTNQPGITIPTIKRSSVDKPYQPPTNQFDANDWVDIATYNTGALADLDTVGDAQIDTGAVSTTYSDSAPTQTYSLSSPDGNTEDHQTIIELTTASLKSGDKILVDLIGQIGQPTIVFGGHSNFSMSLEVKNNTTGSALKIVKFYEEGFGKYAYRPFWPTSPESISDSLSVAAVANGVHNIKLTVDIYRYSSSDTDTASISFSASTIDLRADVIKK